MSKGCIVHGKIKGRPVGHVEILPALTAEQLHAERIPQGERVK